MKKILIGLIIAAVIIGGLIYFLQNQSKTSSPGQPQSSGAGAEGKTYNVMVANFAFSLSALNIKKGDTVVWTNQDSAPHSISGSGFESRTLSKGESFSFTFDSTGTHDYICGLHPYMKGKIIVE